jgi:predicted TIM-barrel fold metal-dependent hydrolase
MNIKLLLPLALVFGLTGCEFVRSVNNEDIRTAVESAAIETIRILNEEGFDPVKLKPSEVELAKNACRIVGAVLVEGTVEDPMEKVELMELMNSVCRVLGVALSTSPEVITVEEVPVDG